MNSREKLIAAARQCLLDLGHEQTTVKAIAQLAGVNHGLVHHYFGSKENLMVEVIRQEQKGMLENLYQQPTEKIIDVILAELLESPERPRLFVEFLSMAGRMPKVAVQMQEVMRNRDTMLREKLGIQDPSLRWLLGSAVLGMALGRQIMPDAPTRDAVEYLRKLVLANQN